jgi:hypothetical protein
VEIHYFKHMIIRNSGLSDARLKEFCYHFTILFKDKIFKGFIISLSYSRKQMNNLHDKLKNVIINSLYEKV